MYLKQLSKGITDTVLMLIRQKCKGRTGVGQTAGWNISDKHGQTKVLLTQAQFKVKQR